MRHSREIFIASSSEDVQFYLDSKVLKSRNIRIIATSLDACNKLESAKVQFESIHHVINSQTIKSNYKETAVVVKMVSKDRALRQIFSFENLDLFELISYDLYFFLNRILLGYETYKKMFLYGGKSKIWISNNAVDNFLQDVINNDFMPFVIKNLRRMATLRMLNMPQNYSNASYSLLKIPIKIASHLLLARGSLLPKNADVIFLCPGSHSVLMIKVFKELAKRNVSYLLIAHNLTAKEKVQLRKNNISFIDRLSLYTKDGDNTAKNISKQITRQWKQKGGNVLTSFKKDSKSRFLYTSIMLRIDWFIRNELHKVLKDYYVAKDIVKVNDPKIFITTTDPNIKVLPFIIFANKSSISTLTLQHGAYAWPPGANFQSNKMLTWGSHWSKWIKTKLNKNKEDLVVTGSVFFDKYRIHRQQNRKTVNSVLILMSLPTVFLLQFKKEFKNLIYELSRLDITLVYLRAHPWQDVKPLAKNSNIGVSIKVANTHDLNYYIGKSQLIITMNTTAGFQAFLSGKPLVYWDFIGDNSMPLSLAGVANVQTAKEASLLVEKYMKGKFSYSETKRKDLLAKVFFKLDGLSSKRVSDKIYESLNK